MESSLENEIKVILLGDCGVGKTNIISRYINDEFKDSILSTSGANYVVKSIDLDGKNYQLNIWDTAGQEAYRSVTKMFIQDSQILILCYSIIEHKTFEDLDFWYNLAIEIVGKDIILGIAGNKSDLFEIEKVKDSEGKNYAKSHNAIFKLISAKEDKKSIDLLFEELLREYIKKTNDNEINGRKSVKIDENTSKKGNNKKRCC